MKCCYSTRRRNKKQIQHHLGFGSFFHSIQFIFSSEEEAEAVQKDREKPIRSYMYNVVTSFGKQNKTKKRERFAKKIRR